MCFSIIGVDLFLKKSEYLSIKIADLHFPNLFFPRMKRCGFHLIETSGILDQGCSFLNGRGGRRGREGSDAPPSATARGGDGGEGGGGKGGGGDASWLRRSGGVDD